MEDSIEQSVQIEGEGYCTVFVFNLQPVSMSCCTLFAFNLRPVSRGHCTVFAFSL